MIVHVIGYEPEDLGGDTIRFDGIQDVTGTPVTISVGHAPAQQVMDLLDEQAEVVCRVHAWQLL